MKTIKYILFAVWMAVFATACDKDGDFITTDGGKEVVLGGNTADIILDYEKLDALALSLYWTDNGELSLSDTLVAAPDGAIANMVQLAADESFASPIEILKDKGVYYHQFTVYDLNSTVGRLGFESGIARPLYIRIKSSLGANIADRYSNAMVVNVTPYTIDKTVGYILDASRTETAVTLASPASDGIYTGFMGVAGWYNFFLKEGDGITWGNDGISGTPFVLSSEDTQWNFWFPGLSGCYYTIVDTQNKEWSALFLESLNVTGDIEGEMEYDRKANKWTYTFNAGQAGTATIRIHGSGKQYNVQTGTDDASAISTLVAFGQENERITFGTEATDITVNLPAQGETTLILDLSNPKEWTCTVGNNQAPAEEVNRQLYISGIDDVFSGEWNFARFLTLYNEDELAYAGVINVNSAWGYRFYPAYEEWEPYYSMAEGGTAESGMLVQNGEGNILAPSAGLYLVKASLSQLTYTTESISSVAFTGFNDDWTLSEMTAAETPGVYSGSVQITGTTPWGFQIVLNENWDLKFGCGENTLFYGRGENNPEVKLDSGTYTLTVNLCEGTYMINKD